MANQAPNPIFRVGLLGESPNDTYAVARLLTPRYGGRVQFYVLIKNMTGDNLENDNAFRLLRTEYEYERINLVIVIRDLDALETDTVQSKRRRAYFRKVKKRVDGKAVFLLNIYSIEALLAADIAVFNEHYQCACVIEGDVMTIEKPVEVLKAATQACKYRYLEAHCGDLLAKVDYEVLLANCRYFQVFDREFAAWLPAPT